MKAFPNNRSEGMDLRDYFAAKAMQSILVGIDCGPDDIKNVVESAYVLADAMMEARKVSTAPITRDFKVDEALRGRG
jgi:hypothetical protein